MFGSLRLGKFFGIDTYVHGTFWLLPLFVFVSGAAAGDATGAVGEVLFLFALFGCVALHEVGHALAARYYGVRTRDITLYPMGGVASLERMPEKPGQEIVIALAGPVVNVVIAAGIFAGLLGGVVALPGLWDFSAADPLDGFVVRLMAVNVGLVLFNLIPAFPMDGGRVLRAVLATGMTRLDATRAAVGVGSALAVGGGVYGLMAGNFMLAFVAVVVFLLGHAELAAVRVEDARRRWRGPADADDVVRVIEVRPHDSYTGWVWDARRQVWVEWRDGVAVREVYP
ncbi:MAG TPA: M50 family metallopeptidase [Urbifossiella sp.]|nr:M50 family metallopeptidase [Urbifossiella sp.]